MAKSVAKFGVAETAKADGKTKEDWSVVAYALKLVSEKRVPQDSEKEELEAGKGVSDPMGGDVAFAINVISEEPTLQAAKEGVEGGADDEFESTYSGTTAASRLTTADGHEHSTAAKDIEQRGLIVEASREGSSCTMVVQIGYKDFQSLLDVPFYPSD
ncbi:hypothetical protein EST38_g2606 [Candolleomyces aberdarensis]|uniref:Uncharacterized protein n=1 Tax=Candolleomyces aberdarensis TaxID=2316362 RepID=A0A4Q2DSJ9_9AGAR|nr:hypothetical protein EST38_g2606 [Candolleomyces aberdarensis]